MRTPKGQAAGRIRPFRGLYARSPSPVHHHPTQAYVVHQPAGHENAASRDKRECRERLARRPLLVQSESASGSGPRYRSCLSISRVSLSWRVLDATPEAVAIFRRLASLDLEIACFGRGSPVVGSAWEHLALIAAGM